MVLRWQSRALLAFSPWPAPLPAVLLIFTTDTREPRGYHVVRRSQGDTMLLRNKQLCSTCRETKMIRPRVTILPNDLTLSFENFMNQRMMGIHPPKVQTVPRSSPDDILTESIHYRLPILGPRTSAFHGILSETYKTLQETQLQLSYLSRKEPVSKMMRQ